MRRWIKRVNPFVIMLIALCAIGFSGGYSYISAQDTSTQAFYRLRVNNGIDSQVNPVTGKNPGIFISSGISGCATAASVGATCNSTFTVNEPDTNFQVICLFQGNTSGVPVAGAGSVSTATSVICQTVAATAAAAQFGSINVLLIHQ